MAQKIQTQIMVVASTNSTAGLINRNLVTMPSFKIAELGGLREAMKG